MKATTILGNSPLEIETAHAKRLADGLIPTRAIMFLSVSQDREAICNMRYAANMSIYRATTTGCGGRQMSLGPLVDEEIERVRKGWNVPMDGMISNAELASCQWLPGNAQPHNLLRYKRAMICYAPFTKHL